MIFSLKERATKQVRPNLRGLVATIVAAGGHAPVGNLHRIDMQRLGNDLEAALASVTSRPTIGAFDVSFNQSAALGKRADHYQVHAAVAVLDCEATASFRARLAQALEAHQALDRSVARPLLIQPLNDPVRQISYLLKSLFSRRVSITDRRARANTLAFPLKDEQAAEIAAWLDSHSLRDRLILANLSLAGAKLVRIDGPARLSSRA